MTARPLRADPPIPAGQKRLAYAIFEARAQDPTVDDMIAQTGPLVPVVADHGAGPVCEGYSSEATPGGSLHVTCNGDCLWLTRLSPQGGTYRYGWPLPARIRKLFKGEGE